MAEAGDLVLDASVAVKLLLEEEGSAGARRILGEGGGAGRRLHVPETFFAECGHVFRRAVIRSGFPPRWAEEAAAGMAALDLVSWPVRDLVPGAVALANAEGLSVYDACYVVLSDRLGAPLLTADRRLRERLRGSGHAVAGPGKP